MIVVSNNTAELTGIGEALFWLLTSNQEEQLKITSNTSNTANSTNSTNSESILDYEVIIYSDSEYAFKSVLGIYNGNKNRLLIEKIRLMHSTLQNYVKDSNLFARIPLNNSNQLIKIVNLRFQHIKGHSGHRWNDRADFLANLGAEKRIKSNPFK